MEKLLKALLLTISLLSISCVSNNANEEIKMTLYSGNIYLYGESHGDERIINKEFKILNEFYNNGMRHLFLELPYFTGEFLNIWMKEENDTILNEIFNDSYGTAGHNDFTLEFYKKIKRYCPEIIIHGTDIGHQYNTTGYRYLSYLKQNNMSSSIKYKVAQENIEQGIYYYKNKKDAVFRENKMVENFIKEINSIDNIDIMGIYGRAHTGLEEMNYTKSVPSMANQLKTILNTNFKSVDLKILTEPLSTEKIKLNKKIYVAEYFGVQSLNGFKDFEYRKFWRIQNAYNDFENNKSTNDNLPYNNYPMKINKGQLFMIEYKKIDGTLFKSFYISNGKVWRNRPTTVDIIIPNEN